MTVQQFIQASKVLCTARLYASDPDGKETLLNANLYLLRGLEEDHPELKPERRPAKNYVAIGNGLYAMTKR